MSAFQPSKLGTKEHWDGVYNEEMKNFEEIGDEGEIWFGEDSMEKMVQWSLRNAPPSRRVLEVGSGNGLLLCELAKNGYDPSRLSGIDYSPGSITLSRQVAKSRGFDGITFRLCDFLSEDLLPISDMQEEGSVWDLLLDKGTFDAIALAEKDIFGQSPSDIYPARVSRLLRPGGLFLITSCNFTEEELKSKFLVVGTGLIYHSRIQHKTYSYGGKSGSVCSSVAFQKSV
ncbi:S-adenosyl-L-methionine-dependent methyltransferase [Gautieria morchelliformis]|nr:S-adenosyl-L-methionine-dependent methyltransferase [Gautieria morchelliformis]